MRSIFLTLFVLIIYTTNTQGVYGQEITLSIQGENQVATHRIDSIGYNPKHSSFQSADSVITQTKKSFRALGYFSARETSREQKDDSLKIELALGNYYKNIQLHISPNSSLPTYLKQLAIPIRNDSIVVTPAFAKALLEKLTQQAADSGKPFTSFQLKNLTPISNTTVSGNLVITEDATRYLNAIIIEGYPKMPQAFIKRYAGLKKNRIFNSSQVQQQQDALDALPFVSIKKDTEIQFTRDSTNLYLYLNKQSANRFDGFLGFASDPETNELQLDGYLDLALVNNLNYGESLFLNYKSDGDDQQQLRIKTELPYLFGSPLGASAELYLFRKDTTFSETTQQAKLYYQLRAASRIELGYKYKTSDNLLDVSDTPDDLTDYSLNALTAGLNLQRNQNNYLFPIKSVLSATAEFGKRKTTSSTQDQIGATLLASNIFKLNQTNQVYIRSNTQLLASDNYVTNELFRFGGITSIRGFEENSIFANLTTVLNTEYRYVIGNSAYIHSIIDAGYFENELLNSKTRLFSIGFGAGLRTKAGIFKINIANGKSEKNPFKFSNTKVHLQLETRF